jgi:DNA-binding IscR family transcriptional regulator
VSRYEFESEALNISNYQKKALTLAIMNLITRNFSIGEPPLTAETISIRLKIPIRLVQDILTNLNSVQLVSMVITDGGKERHYQPAMDINSITVSKVLSRIEKRGIDPKGIIKNKDFEKIEQILTKFDKIIAKSELNVLMKDL